MKTTFTAITALCCTLQMHAQAFGDLYRSIGRYEISDTVFVTRYMDGVPSHTYTVTGDDKLRIMKAIGFIVDDHQPELVGMQDALTRRQPYSYLRNVAPIDKGVVYEIAPFLRYQMLPYRLITGTGVQHRSHIGGILITGDRRDSTVVFGTVAHRPDGQTTLFNYPLQYVRAVPSEGRYTWSNVQALRNLMSRLDRYAGTFVHYGTPWQLQQSGQVRVNWYKGGVLKRQSTIASDTFMPWLNGYLRSLYIDRTGRGYGSSIVIPGGYRSGMTADDFTRDTHNRYHELIRQDCIEILLPAEVKSPHVRGILIQLGKQPARVYGLTDEKIVGEPYLFYTDRTATTRFNRWLKKNTR